MADSNDEILEALYLRNEAGAAATLADLPDGSGTLLDAMRAEGLIETGPAPGTADASGAAIRLTTGGHARAQAIIRLHRLAERLLEDVLELDESASEEGACRFEHCLSGEVADSICTLLGHPTTCPHGKPIPPGPCCRRDARGVEPVVVSLAELPSGRDARVLYIGTRHHARLDRLASMGLLPGVELHLHQRHPALVIQLGQTTLALDQSIAKDIFVRLKSLPRKG